jgi:hypothetical protein
MLESQTRPFRLLFTLTIASFLTLAAFGDTPLSAPLSARGAGSQSNPSSATNGRDFLLVWSDSRSGNEAIYATRVAADGSVLDPEGILLSNVNERSWSPSVAWTGISYVVAWQSIGCQFRRLTADGRVDARPSRVFDDQCASPHVAGSGGTAIIAASRPYQGVQVAAIDPTGLARRLGAVSGGGLVDVACSDSDCLLTWSSWRTIEGRFIGRRGERFDSAVDAVLATDAVMGGVAATSDRFMLVWRDPQRVWARELDPSVALQPFVVKETDTPSITSSSIAPSGRGFLVAWTQHREQSGVGIPTTVREELRARRIGEGEEKELTITTSRSATYSNAIASNGDTDIAAWSDSIGKLAAGIARNGAPLSRIAVTHTATAQAEPRIVNCGDHLLVVWTEELEGTRKSTVLARRFRFNGEPLDARPIAIADSIYSQNRPAAAFDGQSYLVAWSESEHGTHARGINRDGTLAADVIALAGVAGGVDVVATDRGFAILHRSSDRQLTVTRVGAESIHLASSWYGDAALAWNGKELVALWGAAANRVLAARITADGVLLDREPILVGFGRNQPESLSIACDEGECIAAWAEFLAGVNIVTIAGGAAYAIGEPIQDFGDYRTPPTDRYFPTVLRRADAWQVIASGPGGALYSRALRNGVASPETRFEANKGSEQYTLAETPEGLVIVEQRATFGPVYAGARRLYLRQLSETPVP